MRTLITVTILLSLGVLARLVPPTDPPTVLVFAGLSVAGLGVIVAMWVRAWTNPVLPVLAALLGVAMILNGISFVRTQLGSGGSLAGVRTPLVGVFLVGLPALLFAVTGRPRVESFFGPVREPDEHG